MSAAKQRSPLVAQSPDPEPEPVDWRVAIAGTWLAVGEEQEFPCDELVKLEVSADGVVTGMVDDGDGIWSDQDGKLYGRCYPWTDGEVDSPRSGKQSRWIEMDQRYPDGAVTHWKCRYDTQNHQLVDGEWSGECTGTFVATKRAEEPPSVTQLAKQVSDLVIGGAIDQAQKQAVLETEADVAMHHTLRKVVTRIQRMACSAAFSGWDRVTAERVARRHILQKVATRIKRMVLSSAFEGWAMNVAEKKNFLVVEIRIIKLIQRRLLSRCLVSWSDMVLERHHQRELAAVRADVEAELRKVRAGRLLVTVLPSHIVTPLRSCVAVCTCACVRRESPVCHIIVI